MLTQLKEGLRIWSRAKRVRQTGFKRYQGTPEQICKSIIDDAYDKKKKYYRVSSGHFCEFYVRDFAFTCEALVDLGHEEEVAQTLAYALAIFEKQGRVEGSISPEGVAFTFPRFGPDSLALLLYALTHTKNHKLAQRHKALLQQAADDFAQQVIDKRTLLPYANKRFSSIRDHAKRKASCYDAVMCAVVARECKALGIKFPYTEKQLRDRLVAEYWNGTYFFADSQKQELVIGDANVFPFWTGIITDKKMIEEAMTAVRAAGLDQPFPLRYVSPQDKPREKVALHFADWFAEDYETDSVWMHLGLCYLRVLRQVDRKAAAKHLASYERNIRAFKTFLEVYDTDGAPFRTTFYAADEAMVWCANWLAMKKGK